MAYFSRTDGCILPEKKRRSLDIRSDHIDHHQIQANTLKWCTNCDSKSLDLDFDKDFKRKWNKTILNPVSIVLLVATYLEVKKHSLARAYVSFCFHFKSPTFLTNTSHASQTLLGTKSNLNQKKVNVVKIN